MIPDLILILTHATNLERLDLGDVFVVSSITIASRVCYKSITSMQFRISNHGELLAATFLDRFTALRVLIVSLVQGADLGGDEHFFANVSPLKMPRLQTLSLGASSPQTTIVLDLVNKCDAPNLQTLRLGAPVETIETARQLADMCPRLAVQEISLELAQQHHATVLPHIRGTSLRLKYPKSTIFDHLPPTVKILIINLRDYMSPSSNTNETTTLWATFEALLVNQTGVEDVFLEAVDWVPNLLPGSASWVPKGLEKLIAQLLVLSVKLSKKGIRLRDRAGMTILDYYR
jgi:hypothetical protein